MPASRSACRRPACSAIAPPCEKPARTIRAAYVLYAVASVGVALTSSLGPFLALRALQGCANAFTTPLLVTALAEMTPAATLGRAGRERAVAGFGWQSVAAQTAALYAELAG